jgi:rhodanese-related sulfurtransferase
MHVLNKKYSLVFILMSFFFIGNQANAQSALKVNSIEFKASYYKYKGLLIDVRTPYEYEEGHIEKARNIDVNSPDFLKEIEKIPRDQAVFLYCGIGVRSAKAANIFRKNGFKYVYDLDGGYEDLIKVGMRSVK